MTLLKVTVLSRFLSTCKMMTYMYFNTDCLMVLQFYCFFWIIKKNSTGHFQSYFFVPSTLNLKTNSRNSTNKNVWPKIVKWKRTQLTIDNWASSRENLSSGGCEQHRCRPACASAQPDQHLCYSLFRKYDM